MCDRARLARAGLGERRRLKHLLRQRFLLRGGGAHFSAAAELLRGEPETLVPLPRILGDLWPHAAPLFLGDLASRLDPGLFLLRGPPGGGAPFSAAAIASEYFPNSRPIPQNFG